MVTRKKILDDLIEFFGDIWSRKLANKFTEESVLEDSLRIAGDDTDELMYKIFTHYQIDVGDYSFDNYFVGEGFLFDPLYIIKLVMGKKLKKRKTVTIGMIVDAIENKRWNDKGIEE